MRCIIRERNEEGGNIIMSLDYKLYLHDSDKAALSALKAIPGFSQVTKAFMKIWSEQQFRLINMSQNLQLSEKQMAKYYNMLPPICEKLGIEVPDLFVKLDVCPNAYTSGDTKPFIVVTSGLFETMPDHLIATALAHECGHIACHHSLYHTMGRFLLSEASSHITGIGNIALYPIQLAFFYWMRCSEFSADRAAMICDGSSDHIVEMMMRFAGYDKDIMADASVDAFLEQAKQYKSLVENNAWNKTFEFMLFQNETHPLAAVRAYDAKEWGISERFQNILEYVNFKSSESERKLPIEINLKKMIGKNAEDVEAKLLTMGFEDIKMVRNTDAVKVKEGNVITIKINNSTENGWYKRCDEVIVEYFEAKTEEEIALEHPGEIKITDNYKSFLGKNYTDVREQLEELGFTKFVIKEMAMSKLGWGEKENGLAKISIGDQSRFDKNTWFPKETEITLYYFVRV